jgi:hypothetical protein
MRIKLRPERQKRSADDDLEAHTVRYRVADLKVLVRLSELSGTDPGEWLRNCCGALAEAFERDGEIPVPFVLVGRARAEKAGLVPPIKDSTSTNEQNP